VLDILVMVFLILLVGKDDRDSRRFPGHEEVLRYSEDFAREFRLHELVRYQTEVQCVGLETDGMWKVCSRSKVGDDDRILGETYDAVVVCNGHYTEPRIADIPGESFHCYNLFICYSIEPILEPSIIDLSFTGDGQCLMLIQVILSLRKIFFFWGGG